MAPRKSVLRHSVIAALAAMASQAASTAEATPFTTPWVRIDTLVGGWNIPAVRVQTTGAFSNPDGCAVSDGYLIDPAMTGAQLFSSMLLMAQAAGFEIQLTIDGCAYLRPSIIGVTLRRAA